MSVRGLKGLGYQVMEAANGLAGLKLWQEHSGQIDLLLTDMVMPEGLTGLALAEKLKAEKPNLKVIICSGYNEDMSGQTTAELKGIRYLQKPYEIVLLSKKVRECLDGA
jgi:CheY-like chemotaxis protein